MRVELANFTIRSWHWDDRTALVQHANNRNVWINLRDRFPHPYTISDAKRWLKSIQNSSPETNFAIEVDDQAVGGIGFILNSDINRISAEIGYWLSQDYWGRGIMTSAVKYLTNYALDNHNLTRLYAQVFERNIGSIKVLERSGYQFEARLRKSAIKDGQIIDELLYAYVKD